MLGGGGLMYAYAVDADGVYTAELATGSGTVDTLSALGYRLG